ncbi:MAG: hypothetical protein KDK70_08715 [Myxococcales bacterium]|nr:hypothetical protein [Myxococcales bacterium]
MATTSRFATPPRLALGLLLGTAACNDLEKLDPGSDPSGAIPPAVQRAFDETCAFSGCHDSGAAGGLDLTAAAAPSIIGGMSTSPLPMVDPGNVNGSYLAVKMLETPPEGTTRVGARMPIGGDFDDPNNLVILGWIATASPSGGGGTTTNDPTTDGSSESSTGSDVQACGLSDVAPDAADPYDVGMNAGQIPPDIGDALRNNCGCHGVDPAELIPGALPYTGMLDLTTIAGLQADHNGMPAYDVVLGRVDNDSNPMPPSYFCDLGGEPITAADKQLLIDWLGMGAPDAASWSG